MTAFLTNLAAKVAEIRKALVSAAGVAVAIEGFSGTPTGVKDIAAAVLAILAAGGITWKVSNAPAKG